MWTVANKNGLTPMHPDKSVVQWGCCRRKRPTEAVYSCLFHLMVVPTGGSSKRLFCFYGSRTPHDSKHLTRGGAEEKRTRYAARLGGSSRIIRAAGHIIKPRGRRCPTRHMMILLDRGEAPSLSAPSWGRGVFG
jgi:hypothetical protein